MEPFPLQEELTSQLKIKNITLSLLSLLFKGAGDFCGVLLLLLFSWLLVEDFLLGLVRLWGFFGFLFWLLFFFFLFGSFFLEGEGVGVFLR